MTWVRACGIAGRRQLPIGRLRPAQGRDKSPRGECMKLLAEILRDDQGSFTPGRYRPQTALVEARGMDMWHRAMRDHVGGCLRWMRDQGQVVSDGAMRRVWGGRWRLVDI